MEATEQEAGVGWWRSMPVAMKVVTVAAGIGVLGMIVALSGPSVWCSMGCGGQRGIAEAQMSNFNDALQRYVLDHHELPATLGALATERDGNGDPYMSEIPRDPWGQPYRYRVVDAKRRELEIRSAGEDERFGTDDDVVWPEKVREASAR
jgi:general secretion pathway protein G